MHLLGTYFTKTLSGRINMKLKPIKEYTAVVSVEWSTSLEAGSKENFIEKVKEQFKQDYNIDLVDEEISILDEEGWNGEL